MSTEAHPQHHTNYVKIWAILVALLVVSVIGPMLGHPVLTLVTAFGIAFIKAYLVAVKFMHIDREPKFVTYFVVTCLAFMALLFAGVAPDVMKHDGHHWQNVAAEASIHSNLEHQAHEPAHGEGHSEGHHE
ncbi:MAG: cytochrome C oxidase subunit IV family protein [Myxococcota bacterium]